MKCTKVSTDTKILGDGASFARKLAELGIHLVLVARRSEPLETLAQQVAASGVQVRILAADLKQADVLERIRAVTDDIEVGLLIFNAGNLRSTISLTAAPCMSRHRTRRCFSRCVQHHGGRWLNKWLRRCGRYRRRRAPRKKRAAALRPPPERSFSSRSRRTGG